MGFSDLIRELRTAETSPKKASKAMTFLGWGCLVAGAWNFILPQVTPFEESGFRLPAYYPALALAVFAVIGVMFLLSARGIREMEPWGKRVGQGAVVLLFAASLGFFSLVGVFDHPVSTDQTFRTMAYVVFAIGVAQFGVPAYFGIRYLGRLPVKSETFGPSSYNPREISQTLSERVNEGITRTHPETRYKDSPFPFGIMGTFPLLIAVPLLAMFIAQKYGGPESAALLFPVFFVVIFVGPTTFNYLPSPFQKNRKLVASFTGGGSIFLFHGSLPFFRLLVYNDALEVRVMFHRFLIPYDRMEEIPDKVGFFSSGILIRSDLPEVPSSIRFSGFGLKKIVQVVCGARRSFLGAS